MSDNRIELQLRGPGVDIDRTIEAGRALKDLLAVVAEELGAPKDACQWQIESVAFQCDGCGLRRPDRPSPDEGWTYRDGDDLCPACSQSEGTPA